MIENGRSILCSNIGALPVASGRVVKCEKEFEKLLKGNLGSIEGDLNDFGMPGASGADLPIAWILHRAAGITRDHALDAFDLLEYCFQTPEAATAKCGKFVLCTHRGLQSWIRAFSARQEKKPPMHSTRQHRHRASQPLERSAPDR